MVVVVVGGRVVVTMVVVFGVVVVITVSVGSSLGNNMVSMVKPDTSTGDIQDHSSGNGTLCNTSCVTNEDNIALIVAIAK